MPSLRQFISCAGPIFGMSGDSCRELGRAIHREMPFHDGSAKPVATPLQAAQLVLGALAGGPQCQAGERVRRLSGAEPVGPAPQRCAITGATFLIDALFQIMTRPEILAGIDRVEVIHDDEAARIVSKSGATTIFVGHVYLGESGVTTVTAIGGDALAQIANLLVSVA